MSLRGVVWDAEGVVLPGELGWSVWVVQGPDWGSAASLRFCNDDVVEVSIACYTLSSRQ
jgi:hypothetical protein